MKETKLPHAADGVMLGAFHKDARSLTLMRFPSGVPVPLSPFLTTERTVLQHRMHSLTAELSSTRPPAAHVGPIRRSRSIPSRSSELRRWRSNSMPLQSMRTKSAGLLGALAKLPPLERNGSGEGMGLRGGEGGAAGDFRRGSGGLRNITSAPTTVGSYPPSVTTPSPAASARMDTAKAGEPTDGRTPAPAPAGLSGGQYCCLGPVDRAADRAAGLFVSRGSAERSLDWKAKLDSFTGGDGSSAREVGESGGGKRAIRSRAASLAPISVLAAMASVTAEAEGAEALMVNTSLGGGGLGSSAVFGFGDFSSGSGGGIGDKSGFLACSTPGGTNSSNALFARPPPEGHFLAPTCGSSGSGFGQLHGVAEAGARPRRGGGCGDGKVSVV